ncbi:MAG: hypothetical protein QXN52_07780 [Nitrososphaerota archaeon]
MINFTKLSSLTIIILFFPISFYFNIIPINCNSENNLQVDLSINIYSEGYGNSTKWYADIFYLFLRRNNETLVIEEIDWGEINRNGNVFYIDIQIKKFRNRNLNEIVLPKSYTYELGILEDGNYTFIVYVNGEKCYTQEFTAYREIKLGLQYNFGPALIWNGEEWVAIFKIRSNMIPKGIRWGPLIRTKGGFLINIEIDEWVGTPTEYFNVYDERNYSLGILPEGNCWFYVYVNDNFHSLSVFDISNVITISTIKRHITTETYTITYTLEVYCNTTFIDEVTTYLGLEIINGTTTYVTKIRIFKAFTYSSIGTTLIEKVYTATYEEGYIETYLSTINVKKTKTAILSEETIKTIQASQTSIKENPKGEFEIEQFIIPMSLFIIVIMITFLLYYILFKRREI